MKFWVYVNGEVPGCFTPEQLAALPGFSSTTLICPAEGEILEKNWCRAGEFPEVMPVLQMLAARSAPPPPPEPPAPMDVEKLLDTAGNRLFSHVADLMKELEHRREEKGLILSLQRQIMDLKDQLQAQRERYAKLESRLPRLTELEEAQRRYEDRIQGLEASLRGRDEAFAELRIQLEKARNELESSKRSLGEISNDLAIRNRLVEKLSHDLTDKEVNLAKALSLLRRLEEDLNTIRPDAIAADSREQIQALAAPPALPTAPAQTVAAAAVPVDPESAPPAGDELTDPVPRAAYTTDEPPQPPEVITPPPPERPAAHNALMDFLKKIVNKPEI